MPTSPLPDLAAYVQQTVAQAPPLSDRQRDRVTLVLRDPAAGRRAA